MDSMAQNLPYKLFRGFRIPKGAIEEFFMKASDHQPKKGEIMIVSYPKCGTTWLQHIVFLLIRNSEPALNISQVISAIPFPEQDGFPKDSKYMALKFHLPFHLMRYSEEAKYIYIARNPKDVCVSYYHFLKKLPGYNITNFEDFFEAFLHGELPYGDFTDHVMGWYERRHLPNILFINYEELFYQPKETILKMETFLEFKKLNETAIEGVLKYSRFEFMKNLAEQDSFMRRYLHSCTRLANEDGKEPKMMRKGIVGDWKNYFSQEQNHRMEEYLESKLGNAQIMNLWTENSLNNCTFEG